MKGINKMKINFNLYPQVARQKDCSYSERGKKIVQIATKLGLKDFSFTGEVVYGRYEDVEFAIYFHSTTFSIELDLEEWERISSLEEIKQLECAWLFAKGIAKKIEISLKENLEE